MQERDVYDNRFKPLYRYFYYRNVAKDDIEDLIQETFLRFFDGYDVKTLNALDCNKVLYAIGRNVYYEWVRQQKREYTLALEDDHPDDESFAFYEEEVGTSWFDPSKQRALEAALAQLNPTLRTVVVMRFCESKTRREVAETLDIPEKHVHVYQRRALAALEKTLGPNFITD